MRVKAVYETEWVGAMWSVKCERGATDTQYFSKMKRKISWGQVVEES